jgi:protein-S-isoprenylcysteine O-methyltransferase Ste14
MVQPLPRTTLGIAPLQLIGRNAHPVASAAWAEMTTPAAGGPSILSVVPPVLAGAGIRLSNVPVPEAYLTVLATACLLERRRPLPLPPPARGAGPVLVCAGGWLALAATRAAGAVDLADPDRLVVTGPYGHTRHPMYLAWGLVYAGAVLAAGSGWGLILAPAAAVWVATEAAAEERRLAARFPRSYALYRERVPRFVGRRQGGVRPTLAR